jgi:hypothetical protein
VDRYWDDWTTGTVDPCAPPSRHNARPYGLLVSGATVIVVLVLVGSFVRWQLASLPGPSSSASYEGAIREPSLGGYGVVDASGVVATFGGAARYGDQATGPSGSVVATTATSDAKGYWLITTAGKVLPYGDAVSYGSATDISASDPIVSMATSGDGKRYWLVSSSGQVLAFGDADSYGPVTCPVLQPPTAPSSS